MIKVNLLKAQIVKNGMTQKELCKKIGMAESTFIRKMKRGVLNTDEAQRIVQELDICNPECIFLPRE